MSCQDCERPVRAGGLCTLHYQRLRSRGSTYPHVPARCRGVQDKPIVGPSGAHKRCSALWGPASCHPCVGCGQAAREWAYDGTDPTEQYAQLRRSPSDTAERWQLYSNYPEFYMPLCLSCHRGRDRRSAYAELHEYRLWKNRTGLRLPKEEGR